MSDSPDQAEFKSDQNYTVDVNQIYTDWINPIDAIRSYSSIELAQDFTKLSSSSNKKDMTSYTANISVQSTPQESRCHAFYRLIGFPVVGNGNKFYNPGHDIHKLPGYTIAKINTDDIKFTIASNPIDGFNALSASRESFFKENLKAFSIPENIEAGTLALSSGGTKELRKFSSPFQKDASALDTKIDNQKYQVNLLARVGSDENVSLASFKDAGGKTKPPPAERRHIIKPFIVDARIDVTVLPQSKLVAVPFALDDSFLKVSSTESAKRPLLEKIIRDRQPINNPIAGTSFDKIADYIKKESTLTNSQIIQKLQKDNSIADQNTQDQFIDTLNIILAMVEEIVHAEKVIKQHQSSYYWVPKPDKLGPDSGVNVQGVFLPTYIEDQENNKLSTPKDRAILEAYFKSFMNNANVEAVSVNGAPSADSFALTKTDFSSKTASGLGDNNTQNLETLSKTRLTELNEASQALRTIEIIMGEFTGLGLCDIVAIVGALKILPLTNLYGLLDDDAYKRMLVSLSIKDESKAPRASMPDSMDKLALSVKNFYDLMDSVYKTAKQGKS